MCKTTTGTKMKINSVNYNIVNNNLSNLRIKQNNTNIIKNSISFGMKFTWDDRVLDFVVNELPELEKNKGKVNFITILQKYVKEISDNDFMQILKTKDSNLFNNEEELHLSVDEDFKILSPRIIQGEALVYYIYRPEIAPKTATKGHLWWRKQVLQNETHISTVLKYTDKYFIKNASVCDRAGMWKKLEIPKLSIEEMAQRIKDTYLKIREELLQEEELKVLNENNGIDF